MASTQNPKDSMKSTWRDTGRTGWKYYHYLVNMVDPFHADPKAPVPVFNKNDKLPVLSRYSMNRFVLSHALWPMALQAVYFYFTGTNLHPVAAFFLYSTAWKINAAHQARIMARMARVFGFLDGDKHGRDEVPDTGVLKVLISLEITTSLRPLLVVFLTYCRNDPPLLSWWLPVELFLYSCCLDFFFYVYHRACHEIDFLWKYHRTHHLTKHPSPLLTAYADAEQEFIELLLIPVLTWATLKYAFGMPMGFYDWWMCHQYVIFSESLGHSGLRMWMDTPGVSSPILSLFGANLVVEDHDLHHRHGWRKSYNYGKQTLLWDVLFGTKRARLETADENVNWEKTVHMPVF